MSTENNSDQIFKNSIKILTDLIAFKTISGEDNNALINYCDDILKKNGGWTNCLPTPFQYPENNVSIYLLRTPPRFSSATRPLYFPQLLRYPFGRDYSATPIPLRREGKLIELLPRHQ